MLLPPFSLKCVCGGDDTTMIFVFQSVLAVYTVILVQLGVLWRNYQDSVLLGNLTGDVIGVKAVDY